MHSIDIAAFCLHALGAIICTILHFACGKTFAVDTYQDLRIAPFPNTTGFGLAGGLDPSCYTKPSQAVCTRQGLPLYQAPGLYTRWHPLALLGHFELVSTAFSLIHVYPALGEWCASLALLGFVVFAPYTSGATGLAELLTMAAGSIVASILFYYAYAPHGALDPAVKVGLRYAEYAITAPELFVAVLCVFITEPSAFMPLAGLILIAMCNLGGLQMHWALIVLRSPDADDPERPPQQQPKKQQQLRVPKNWTHPDQPEEEHGNESLDLLAAMLDCGLFDTWVLFIAAMSLIAYQGQLLFLTDPPWYVTATAWFLLVNYTSFGIWATLCYGLQWSDDTLDTGFAVLSPVAKLGIVGMLAFAFAFQSVCCGV